MANTSSWTPKRKDSDSSDSCTMDASSDSEYLTILAATDQAEHAATSSSTFFTARSESIQERTENGQGTSIEEQIERSKSHWSELTRELTQVESNCNEEDEEVMADNVQVFKNLQSHPTFFQTFGDSEDDVGELVMGEKFAEGGQAELYQVQVKWRNPKDTEKDLKEGNEWVLKVFRKGTWLRHLQSQFPQRFLEDYAEKGERIRLGKPVGMRWYCNVYIGTLLKDGRFAFLMGREQEDLRSQIDRFMTMRTSEDSGPFSKDHAESIMYVVALGINWLHSRNIVHRDLKASNVLFTGTREKWQCYVADFECSIGVIGTGFFRAPEILQACKEKNVSQRPELFTKQADVYSYGMTCYEILTGKLPFEGHSPRDYDLVLEGQRPEVPEYVDDWTRELLNGCWQSNPLARPTFEEILKFLEANSTQAEGVRDAIWRKFSREEITAK